MRILNNNALECVAVKNILITGNGFDLYYNLPTKYANFLNVVSFLLENKNEQAKTVGDVFANKELLDKDAFIATCYEKHKKAFDETVLDESVISEIVNPMKNNLWFSCLCKIFNKDVGWIDFEKEISYVLQCFEQILEKDTILHFKEEENHIKYVSDIFGFLIDKVTSTKMVIVGTYKVKTEYCLEIPFGSKNHVIDKEKVVEKLYSELVELSKALKLYLKHFVENVVNTIKANEKLVRIGFFAYMDKVISFNYTNTYETFYNKHDVFYIHGRLDDEIVLGINPNASDDLENIDTTFVAFKKYYQRTLFETDVEYLKWLTDFVEPKTPYRLFVMGHSLDVTDKDILCEVLENAQEIIVLYHNTAAKKSYVKNLIGMFGKTHFDHMRKKQKMNFRSLDENFSELTSILSEESWNDVHASFDNGEKIEIV